jgi:hypothetical protein
LLLHQLPQDQYTSEYYQNQQYYQQNQRLNPRLADNKVAGPGGQQAWGGEEAAWGGAGGEGGMPPLPAGASGQWSGGPLPKSVLDRIQEVRV